MPRYGSLSAHSPCLTSGCIHTVLANGFHRMLTYPLHLAVRQLRTVHRSLRNASRHCTRLALRQLQERDDEEMALYWARCGSREWGARVLSGVLLFLLGTANAAFAASPSSPSNSSSSTTRSSSAGFTRDSMDALDRPEATPAPTKPLPSLSPTSPRASSAQASTPARQVKRGHRRVVHAKTEVPKPVASPKRPRSRNPIVRFIYWWNGWVVTAFHTKFGTVLYGTIGADTSQLPSASAGG